VPREDASFFLRTHYSIKHNHTYARKLIQNSQTHVQEFNKENGNKRYNTLKYSAFENVKILPLKQKTILPLKM